LTETDYLDENEQMSGKKRTTRQPIVCGTDFNTTSVFITMLSSAAISWAHGLFFAERR